jgi:methyl-accepting chemotaxis protein
MSIRKKILLIAIAPVLILGILSIIFTFTIMKNTMMNEIEEALRGTAAATLAAYDQNTGDYLKASNGDIWKGSYNISKSESLVDRIKENTGMDVTFFYGSERIMTSAVDSNGDRILDSVAGDVIVENVLNSGNNYFSKAVSIDGTLNYGYYMPVYQNGSSDIVGMVFVGTDKEEKDAVIRNIMMIIGASVCIVMAVCAGIAIKMSSSLSKDIKISIDVVKEVAGGNLDIWVDDRLMKKKDEVGELSKITVTLRDTMKSVIKDISSNAKTILEAGNNLKEVADKTSVTMEEVRSAVAIVTQNSGEQAQHSKNTSEYMKVMGNDITETSDEVELLSNNALSMQQSGKQAQETLFKLCTINKDVENIINEVQTQTEQTNTSIQEIRSATELISSIAEQTNMLSLNASIEAARAGESGRGFAVVAEQIKKLADESKTSSKEIDKTSKELIEASQKSVEVMKQMQAIITSQSESMNETQNVVESVLNAIESSMDSIGLIKTKAKKLENSRNEVIQAVSQLSETSQHNVEETIKTHDETVEVADTFKDVAQSAKRLQQIAGQLADSVDYFKI